MNLEKYLDIFLNAIRRTYPEIDQEVPMGIDNEYDEMYFKDRRTNFYRLSDEFKNVELRIKRFRSRFYITGVIEEICPGEEVKAVPISIAIKMFQKTKNTSLVLEK